MEAYELRRGWYKRLTLRVLAPSGGLRISAPWFVPRAVVDVFVAERADWITRQRMALLATCDPKRVWVWGRACLLRVESPGRLPRVVHDAETATVVLRVPAGWTTEQHQRVLQRWETLRVREAVERVLPHWSAVTGLAVAGWTVKTLTSRWGSCRPDRRTLVFNSRLGAYPPECLEYVVVHELAHLVVPHHGAEFHRLVEGWLPGAETARKRLKAGLFVTDEGGGAAETLATPEAGREP